MPLLQRPARIEQPFILELCKGLWSFTSTRGSWRAVRALPASGRPVSIERINAALGVTPRCCLSKATQRCRSRSKRLLASPAVRGGLSALCRPAAFGAHRRNQQPALRRVGVRHRCAPEVVASSSSREHAALSEGCCLRRHCVACKAVKRINSISALVLPEPQFHRTCAGQRSALANPSVKWTGLRPAAYLKR